MSASPNNSFLYTTYNLNNQGGEATLLLRNLHIFSRISMHQSQFLLEIILVLFTLSSEAALTAVLPEATHVRNPNDPVPISFIPQFSFLLPDMTTIQG